MSDVDKLTEKLLAEARPIATEITQDIAELANKRKTEEIAMYAGLLSSLVLQNMLTTLAVQMFGPGSKKGADWLDLMYHEALRDAQDRWKKPDLKAFKKDTGAH